MESLIIKNNALRTELSKQEKKEKKILKISENKRAVWDSGPQANIS